MTDTLTPFEDKEVVEAAIEIPNAAGGLRDAMEIDPQEFHHGERRTIVLDCVVKKVRFDEVKKNEDRLVRVHVFSAESATFIDRSVVEDALSEQAEKIARYREAEKGVQRLPTDEELLAQHEAGGHADELVEGCVECDRELEAEEAERAAN